MRSFWSRGALVFAAFALSFSCAHADPKIAVDGVFAGAPFWEAYSGYVAKEAQTQGATLVAPFYSQGEIAKQIAGVEDSISAGAKGIIVSPFDPSARQALEKAAAAKIPVVAVETAPEAGPVAMVVKFNDIALGETACKYIGENVSEGAVVQIMGDATSAAAQGRGNGFRDCIAKNYPKLKELEIGAKDWSGSDAANGLAALLNSAPDLKAIYIQSGNAFLGTTLDTLEQHGLLYPTTDSKHVVIVSTGGIPEEFEAIRNGEADATIAQPAALYAKYGISYVMQAMQGKTFAAGPTDHNSTIVEVRPGVLEDQLLAPLITKKEVDDDYCDDHPEDCNRAPR